VVTLAPLNPVQENKLETKVNIPLLVKWGCNLEMSGCILDWTANKTVVKLDCCKLVKSGCMLGSSGCNLENSESMTASSGCKLDL